MPTVTPGGNADPAGMLAWNPSRRKPRARWTGAAGSGTTPPPPAQGDTLVPVRARRGDDRERARRASGGRAISPALPTPPPTPTSTLPPGSVARPVGIAARPRGGRVMVAPASPADPPVTPGLPPVATLRPTGRAVQPRRHPGGVQIGRAFTLPETASGPSDEATFTPTRRREPPPYRGSARLGSLLHFVPPLDGINPLAGITRPVARPEKSRRGRTAAAPGGIAWLHFTPPVVPGPIAWAMSRTAHTPTRRVEPPPKVYQPATGAKQRLTIGPGTHYLIYINNGLGGPIDYTAPIDTTDLTTWMSGVLATPGTWKFGVRAENEYGTEQNLDCQVSILFNANSDDITNIPAPPIALRAFPVKGGNLKVEFTYPPVTIAAKRPTQFFIYAGTGGTPDYSAPAATIPAGSAVMNVYATVLTGLTDGTTYAIGCRAANASGTEPNTTTVSATSDAVGPAPVQSLTSVAIV